MNENNDAKRRHGESLLAEGSGQPLSQLMVSNQAMSLYLEDGPRDLTRFGSWQQEALESCGPAFVQIQKQLHQLGELIQQSGEVKAAERLDSITDDFEVLGLLLQSRMLLRGVPIRRERGRDAKGQ
jgi:hypothetical protein